MSDTYRNRAVTVLGGRGFIGREVVRQLSVAGARVTSVGGGSAETLEDDNAAIHVPGRIAAGLLAGIPERPEIVFHLAGGASVGQSTADTRGDFDRTVSSSIEALEYLRLHNPSAHLVYISSAAVYGDTGSRPPGAPPRAPVSHYGVHKKIAEDLCSFYADKYRLRISTVRPFSVYGPGLRKQLLWDALNKADRGRPEFFGNGSEVRDWVYVSDLAYLLLEVGSGRLAAPVDVPLDAGTSIGVSVEQILTRLLDLYMPGLAPRFLGAVNTGNPDVLVAAHAQAVVKHILSRVSLDEGLQRYVAWYRQAKIS